MAYSNTVAAGDGIFDPGSTFARGLDLGGVRASSRSSIATVFDYKWLRTFAWPIYFVNLGLLAVTLVIGDGVSGAARWIPLGPFQFQFSELAKILMIVVLANYLASRQKTLEFDLDDPRRLRPRGPGLAARAAPAGPRDVARPRRRSSPGCCSCPARAFAGWRSSPAVIIAAVPIAWTYLLRDYQKQRLLSFLDPASDPAGLGLPAHPEPDRGRLGRAVRQGADERDPEPARLPAGPDDRLRLRPAVRGARLPRRDARPRPVRRPHLADPPDGLALAGSVRAGDRRRRSLDARCSRSSSTSGWSSG